MRAWAGSLRERLPIGSLGLVALAFAFALLAPVIAGQDIESYTFFSSLQLFASFGLIALAVGLSMLVGEFDLSVLGLYPLAGVLAVRTGVDEPLVGLIVAVGAGAAIGLLHGVLMASLRLGSVAVTLATSIAMLGVANTLGEGDGAPIGYSNYDVSETLDSPILQIFSWRSVIAIGTFCLIAAVMRFTRYGVELRALGGDRHASRTVGLRVDRLLVAVFVVSGVLTSLAGATYAYSVASGEPVAAWSTVILAVTAALLGGVTLAGGEGTIGQIFLGALALSLLQATLAVLAAPLWVSSVVLAALLVLVATATAPELATRVAATGRRARARLLPRRAEL